MHRKSVFVALATAGVFPIVFTTTALAASAPPLKHVLKNTSFAPYQQESLVENETIKYLGQTIQMATKSVFHVEIRNHQLVEFGTVTEKAQGSTQQVHVFIDSGVEYANTGTGWKVVGKLGANALNNLATAQDAALTVTHTERTKVGFQYAATINPSQLAPALQSILGTLSAASANTKLQASTIAEVLKDGSGSTTIDARLINKYWRISAQSSVINIPVSAAVLSKLTGVAVPPSGGTSVTKKVYGTGGTKPQPAMTILVREHLTLAYAKKPVTAPKGLPKK